MKKTLNIIYSICIVMYVINFFTSISTNNISAINGWLCAILMCGNAILNLNSKK